MSAINTTEIALSSATTQLVVTIVDVKLDMFSPMVALSVKTKMNA